jgi:methylglutaconyl-CoA hydratase
VKIKNMYINYGIFAKKNRHNRQLHLSKINMNPYVHTYISSSGIATISFFHPLQNSLPSGILQELAATITQTGQKSEVKVIILKSDGDRTFCAGASFDELAAIKTQKEGLAFFSGFAHVINACRKCPKIMIGRVQGKAVGGGIGLAAATDYCFATQHAAIKLSELVIGIGPFVVGPVIEKKMGVAIYAQMALRANQFYPASWAKAQKLYAEVFEDIAAMDAAIEEFAYTLVSYHPESLSALKKVLWEGTEHWDKLLIDRAKISGRLVLSAFTKEAIQQFKAKK